MKNRVTRPLVLVGGGGHALSVLACLPDDVDVAGYVDFKDSDVLLLPRIADDNDFLSEVSPAEYEIIITMVSGSDCSLAPRRRLMGRYADFRSPVVVAPTAWVAPDVSLGCGTVVFNRAVVNASSSIGCHSVINTGAIIEHNCNIGNNVFIGPGAVICGGVEIGDDTYIGAGAVVRPGVTVSAGTIVGLCAAVVCNIDVPATYVGVPARKKD